MLKNIVVFGPAHAGKSTLVGYLIAKLMMSDKQVNDIFEDIKMLMGSEYDETESYAYLVDKHKDERFFHLKPSSGDHGHSLYMHFEQLNIGNKKIHIIDTPGAEHRSRDRQKGLFYGDIGLFMIDVADLSESLLESQKWERVKRFLLPLFSSRDFTKGNKRLVVILSKMDTREYSSALFNAAKKRVYQLLGDNTIDVIPIAIDVLNRNDNNVISVSEKMPWFKDKTLFERLSGIIESKEYVEPASMLLPVGRVYDKKWLGLIAEGKLLSGYVKKQQQVKILPVFIQNKSYGVLYATTGSLRMSKGDDIDEATPGDIISVRLQDLRINDRRCEKSDIEIIESTTIVEYNTRIAYGRILKFQINDRNPLQLNVLDNIRILWFGKQLSSRIIYFNIDNEQSYINLEVDNGPVAIPLQCGIEGELLCHDFLLLTQSDRIVQGRLIMISEPTSITFKIKDEWDSLNYFKGFNSEKIGDRMTLRCADSGKEMLVIVRRFLQRHGEDPESENNIHINTEEVYM